MKKKQVHSHHTHSHMERPIRWLPVDSRFITPVFKFGQVKGMARIFLEIEITLCIFVVGGTIGVGLVKIFQLVTK